MIVGVDKDCSRGRIYWSDIVARQILSANYNGTDKQVFIKDGNRRIEYRNVFFLFAQQCT